MKIRTLTRDLPVLFVAIALAACAPTPAPVATPDVLAPTAAQVATPDAPAPTAEPTTPPDLTPAAPGKAFAFEGVEVYIPESVASGASARAVPASEGADLPEFGKNPAYTEIKLDGYPAQNDYFQGMIQVYPVAGFEQISQVAAQRVQDMQALLAEKPAAPGKEIATLPIYNAAQVFRSRVRYLDFQNGTGVRFVTMYSQGIVPATNKEVFYTYQGLTSDGAYWVSAVLPVHAAFLAADQNSAANPPAGGIAFPDLSKLSDTEVGPQVSAYYQAVAGKLDATSAAEFTPGLDALDYLVQSLRVTAP